MNIDIYNIKGEKTGKKLKLNEKIFGIEPNDHAVYLDVKRYMAKQRQGTSKTRERGEVKGSRAKLRRQKGLGHARVGDIKNPIFRGGGRVFGPKPRIYDIKINKKVKMLARRSALTYKAKDKNIIVLEDFSLDEPKTKKINEIFQNLKVDHFKTLLVTSDKKENIILSVRNIPFAQVMQARDINTYIILNAEKLLFFESSVQEIEKLLN